MRQKSPFGNLVCYSILINTNPPLIQKCHYEKNPNISAMIIVAVFTRKKEYEKGYTVFSTPQFLSLSGIQLLGLLLYTLILSASIPRHIIAKIFSLIHIPYALSWRALFGLLGRRSFTGLELLFRRWWTRVLKRPSFLNRISWGCREI